MPASGAILHSGFSFAPTKPNSTKDGRSVRNNADARSVLKGFEKKSCRLQHFAISAQHGPKVSPQHFEHSLQHFPNASHAAEHPFAHNSKGFRIVRQITAAIVLFALKQLVKYRFF